MLDPHVDTAALQRRLFAATRLARGPAIALVVITTIGAAVVVAQMVVASQVIASVHPRPASGRSWTGALTLLLGLVLLRAVLAGLAEWCAQRMATRVKSHLRAAAIAQVVARGPRALARERTGELVTTMMDGVDKLDAYYRRFVPQTMATGIVPIFIVACVAWIDPASAIVLAITGPLIPLFMWLLGTLAAQRTREQWQALGALGGSFLDVLQGLPTLTLSGRGRDAADRLDRASERLRVTTMGVLKVAFLSGFVLEIAATLGTALVAVGVGVRMIEGWIAFQPGLAVLLLAPEFYLPFRQLGQRHHAGMEGVAAAERLFALIDAPDVADATVAARGADADRTPAAVHADGARVKAGRADGRHPDGVRVDGVRADGGRVDSGRVDSDVTLSLRGVGFAYPGAAAPTLIDIDVDFPARSFTAIVGPSGVGKSTLAALLLRFLEPTAGIVTANGRPAHAWSTDGWRHLVTMAPQQPHFFAGTLLDNLRLGRPQATLDDVRAAARMAEADDFITALPDGYETAIDEAAVRLSGGERQRLAIARALVKPAPVLVLDEPSSSLDPVSEAAIARVLARLARERTVIVIAHRHATIERADRIVRLHDGRLTNADVSASASPSTSTSPSPSPSPGADADADLRSDARSRPTERARTTEATPGVHDDDAPRDVVAPDDELPRRGDHRDRPADAGVATPPRRGPGPRAAVGDAA